ncbi:hypothetical protein KM295_09725 [Natronomonas sp. F2-12]|jgi:hypothetical protein|uniref:Uncharacterized protein n=1 Tax=Natronomonas aquatica TaxID=2841590 RepID=A0A9R1CTL6_9EURY|nr:hypothetical protein [Natronomonas aquatica]MCQ4333752.1 hypothetical protein [Natronomonas aquatica]
MVDLEETFGTDGDAAWIAVAVVLFACLGGAVVLAEWPLFGVPPDTSGEPQLVEPSDGGTGLWPYTSRTRSYEGRTLGINMVFYDSPEEVRTTLTERSARGWTDDPTDGGEADAETVSAERVEIDPEAEAIDEVIRWDEAKGATRYTYFETDDGGVWVDESYQLHAGTYLGKRSHIRAYDEPAGEWTAVQIHEEHWDWFRLRHTVTGISEPQGELEREFMDDGAEQRVVRMPFGNGTADGDGWASGIYLTGAVVPILLFGLVGPTRTLSRGISGFLDRRRRELALGAGLFGLYTAVRWLGIGGEALLSVPPKVVAGPLYVALVVGIPAVAYRFGRASDRTWAFALAVLGLGTAIVVDFAAMGVAVLPLRIVLHRGTVLLAAGLIAVGGSIRADRPDHPVPLVFGLAGWVFVIAASLFGYV